MGFADACALHPELATDLADPYRDLQFLNMLARWAERYCPVVSIDNTDGLLLNITGAAHLFGGEQGLIEDLLTRLEKAGLNAGLGLADTIGAAWATARFGDHGYRSRNGHQTAAIIAPGQSEAALTTLPVMALRIDLDTSNTLRRLGLSTIGDLIKIPRATLSHRFDKKLLNHLDFALGRANEPLSPLRMEQNFAARMTLPEPIGLTKDVQGITAKLMRHICAKLETAQKGARQLRLSTQQVDGSNEVAAISLARPMRDPDRMTHLFATAIANMKAGFGIEMIRLEATATEPLLPVQQSHINKKRNESEEIDDLITRIGNRIGFARVKRYRPVPSHLPEKAFEVVPAALSTPAQEWPISDRRPAIMFNPQPIKGYGNTPPQRFSWRGLILTVLGTEGPERIQPEWWQDDPDWQTGMRDYWKVETHQGWRLWMYHTPQADAAQSETWFIHGTFA